MCVYYMSNYKISDHSKKQAALLHLIIKPSKNKNKKNRCVYRRW